MTKGHFLGSLLLLSLALTGCLRRGDAVAPIVTIVDPKSGTVRSSDKLSIEGYALDDEGIRAIRVNGVDLLQDPIYVANRGKSLVHFEFVPQQVSEGRWVSHIEVEDTGGRISTLEFPLQIDKTKPSLELGEISSLPGGRLLVTGTARDNGQVGGVKVNDIELSFGGAAETPFSVAIDAASSITITVTDEAGNQTSESFTP